ncbi:N-acetylmuramoyl-L-alanine amidase CwlD [Bacillus horti]|uniref:N-acetylmuramoyl-L-alanine amidase n=1 Tax=Caldalkalibacillus horti TaxID=77523 RepID=A0ABT9VYN3_9BACI|nr:N-acetylmuramoyl-L-alanine amidase CwlD [Bacillus horti]MDQ0166105.1 N-acetylmuramoyl-L-alanine amidase [Bacillus horti]
MKLSMKKVILFCLGSAALIYIFNLQISYTISDSTWSLPLSGKIIVIDPGHGGLDGGAVSRDGVVEKEIALNISIYLRDLLQESGALVKMTRESDTELSTQEDKERGRRKATDLKNRAHFINTSDGDYLVSIHLNSITSPKWRGAQTFYHPQLESNQELAKLVQDELKRNLENTDRQSKKNQDIFILRQATLPSVLVEVGFLSNPEESTLLSTVEYQKKVAASIYQGVLRHAAGEKLP